MKRASRHPPTLLTFGFLATAAGQIGCGYGFGNHELRDERAAAIAFAQALQRHDTTRLRRLSTGAVKSGIAAILRQTPRAYIAFAKPAPHVLTVEGGGVYGGRGGGQFLVASEQLESCDGGVRLVVILVGESPKVTWMRLVPPPDSATDDACRVAITGS